MAAVAKDPTPETLNALHYHQGVQHGLVTANAEANQTAQEISTHVSLIDYGPLRRPP